MHSIVNSVLQVLLIQILVLKGLVSNLHEFPSLIKQFQGFF